MSGLSKRIGGRMHGLCFILQKFPIKALKIQFSNCLKIHKVNNHEFIVKYGWC